MVKIIETPRDGFQALPNFIDTDRKIEYINQLLKCGFDTVEVGSFVSPRVIPQMADTAKVLESIDIDNTDSDIAVLAVTKKGADIAIQFDQVDQIFFPFSTSPTFLKRNTKQTVEEAYQIAEYIQNLCVKHNKKQVMFFSMGFESAYGDEWSIELMLNWIRRFKKIGLDTFPISDILGDTSAEQINKVFSAFVAEFPELEFGLHLHALADSQVAKVDAAYKAGIRRFDTVINGLGGCPQTGRELVNNLPLQVLLEYLNANNYTHTLNMQEVAKATEYLF